MGRGWVGFVKSERLIFERVLLIFSKNKGGLPDRRSKKSPLILIFGKNECRK